VRCKKSSLLFGLALLIPSLALPATISVNGTCEAGNCSSPDVLNSGGSDSGNLDLSYTLANGDRYFISGYYSTSYSAGTTNITTYPTAVYLGNTANPIATSHHDVLNINLLQNYNYTDDSLDGYYYYHFYSGVYGPIAPDSTYTADLSFNDLSLGPVTYGIGYHNGFEQAYLTGLTNPLSAMYAFTFTFGAGSDPGSTIATLTSAVPEPGSVLLLSIGAIGMIGFVARSSRRKPALEARS
jgi:PEP-CTERM motif